MEKTKAKEFSERLVKIMLRLGYYSPRTSESGIDIKKISEKLNITYEMARRYALGKALPRDDKIQALSDWLQTDFYWLKDGIIYQDKLKLKDGVGVVPILKASQVLEWLSNPYHGNYLDYLPVHKKVSNKAFAMIVEDNSMKVDDENGLGKGSIIIADPAETPSDYDLVVVQINNESNVTFKLLVSDTGSGRAYLKSLNMIFQPIEVTPACNILAKVVAAYSDFE